MENRNRSPGVVGDSLTENQYSRFPKGPGPGCRLGSGARWQGNGQGLRCHGSLDLAGLGMTWELGMKNKRNKNLEKTRRLEKRAALIHAPRQQIRVELSWNEIFGPRCAVSQCILNIIRVA